MKAEYFEVNPYATPAKYCYLSLYERIPFYGGPEEGGWWGEDVILVASMHYKTMEDAVAAKNKIEETARRNNEEAQAAYGRQCNKELEWLEERGLEANFLPEPDGPLTYFVAIEEERGSLTSEGSRGYE